MEHQIADCVTRVGVGKLSDCKAKFSANARRSDEDELAGLLRAVTHDLRASTRAISELPPWILQDLELATNHAIPPSLFELFELMMLHANRLDRALADLSRLAHAGKPNRADRLDIAPHLESAIAQLERGSDFEIDIDLDAPCVFMAAPDFQLLLKCLLSNAVAHHDLARGYIACRTTQSEGGVVLLVHDDGPSIPAAFAERIFEPMTSLKPKDQTEGSGLGLTIARRICAKYGGDIRLCLDQQDRGNTFRCWLPDRPSENH